MGRVKGSLAIIALLAVCACAMNTTRLYTGQHALDDLSIVIWDPSVKPRIEKIDGTQLPQGLMRVQRAEFLPGRHTFTIQMPEGSERFVTLSWETKPGRCYRLQREIMAVSVESSGRVLGSTNAPVLGDTAAAACPTR